MTNDELEHGSFEIENRIRNLMWTISGDYDLDTKPDVTSFYKSKYISIYDAIKQGAFSRFFDKDAFALYLLKKVYLGADESQLVTLGHVYRKSQTCLYERSTDRECSGGQPRDPPV